MLFHRKHGIQSTGTLFVFWFMRTLFGVPQAHIEAQGLNHTSEYKTYHVYSYLTQYAVVCIALVLEICPDERPTSSSYPEPKKPNPELRASFLSRLLFLQYDLLLWKGFRKQLTMDDMYDVNPQDMTRETSPVFDRYWNKSLEKGHRSRAVDAKGTNGSILPVIVKAFGGPFVFAGALQLAMTTLQLASPYFLMLVDITVGWVKQLWTRLFFGSSKHCLHNLY